MTRLPRVLRLLSCFLLTAIVAMTSMRSFADETVTEEKLQQLKQQADEAKTRRDASAQSRVSSRGSPRHRIGRRP